MPPTPDRPSTTITLLLAATAAIVAAGCTSTSAGTPVGQNGETVSGTSRPSTSPGPQPDKSLKDLDICLLLAPADMPVQAGPDGLAKQEPKFGGDVCSTSVQLKDIVSVFVSTVERKPQKFSTFVPPSGSPNGRMTEIAGRRAWVGNPFSDVDKGCVTIFGAADGSISLSVTDETKRGVDPCQTAVQLAEKVIARTPAPRE